MKLYFTHSIAYNIFITTIKEFQYFIPSDKIFMFLYIVVNQYFKGIKNILKNKNNINSYYGNLKK